MTSIPPSSLPPIGEDAVAKALKMLQQMEKDLKKAEQEYEQLTEPQKEEWIEDRRILQKRMQDIPLTDDEKKRIAEQTNKNKKHLP